jgi:hypothetical protein
VSEQEKGASDEVEKIAEYDSFTELPQQLMKSMHDDESVSDIAKNIVSDAGSTSAAALELEALAFVAAASRTPKNSGGLIKRVNINKENLRGPLSWYTRYKVQERDNFRRETTINYNIYYRLTGDIFRPQLDFVLIDENGYADLQVSVIPAGYPSLRVLKAVRAIIWKAAKEVKFDEQRKREKRGHLGRGIPATQARPRRVPRS